MALGLRVAMATRLDHVMRTLGGLSVWYISGIHSAGNMLEIPKFSSHQARKLMLYYCCCMEEMKSDLAISCAPADSVFAVDPCSCKGSGFGVRGPSSLISSDRAWKQVLPTFIIISADGRRRGSWAAARRFRPTDTASAFLPQALVFDEASVERGRGARTRFPCSPLTTPVS